MPWLAIALTGAPFSLWWVLAGALTAGAVALHVHVRPESPGVTLATLVAGLVLTSVAGVAGILLVSAANGCGDGTAAQTIAWTGAIVLYLLAGAWGLQRPRRVWALPVGMLLAAAWVALVVILVPGGQGACFN